MSVKSVRLPDGRQVVIEAWRDGFQAFEGELGCAPTKHYKLDRCFSAYNNYEEFVVNGLQIRGLQKTPVAPERVVIHINDFVFTAANFCEPVRHSWWAETPDGRLIKVREREEVPGLQIPLYWKAPEVLDVSVEHSENFDVALEADWRVVVLLTGAMKLKTPSEEVAPA
jgi:hypothetical protein